MTIKTVFVIGAGASKEAGLPTGDQLKTHISRLLSVRENDFHNASFEDNLLFQALHVLSRTSEKPNGDIKPYINAAKHLCDALPQARSIDSFIDSQPENEHIANCGKLGILRSILEAEKNSKLHIDSSNIYNKMKFSGLANTWYTPFFQILTGGKAKTDLVERFKSATLIIFNYDRCVEHFLFHTLKNYYRIEDKEAAELINQLNIYHPYGSVGSLPWAFNNNSNTVIDFGEERLGVSQLLTLKDTIKTFTEGTDPNSSDISAIKTHMLEANRLIFLGFAFHELNMELIAPNMPITKPSNKPKCFASTFEISESDKKVIQEHIERLYETEISVKMTNSKCNEFFSEFSRSLAF
jgi:hypothetical protein